MPTSNPNRRRNFTLYMGGDFGHYLRRTLVPELQQYADDVWEHVRNLIVPNTVEDVAFTASTTLRVAHKLRRKPSGFRVVRLDAAAIVYEDAASPADSEWIYLIASADCTASLEFF